MRISRLFILFLVIALLAFVAVPAFAIVPNRQVTVPPASEHDPAGVTVAERYVTVEGSASVTVTFVAVAGPLFVTASE